MRYEVLKSVAMPPRLFWAPFLIAVFNLAIQCLFMFFGIFIMQWNPMIFIISTLVSHTIIASYGAKEPHMSNIFKSYGKVPHSSRNMIASKGVKLAS